MCMCLEVIMRLCLILCFFLMCIKDGFFLTCRFFFIFLIYWHFPFGDQTSLKGSSSTNRRDLLFWCETIRDASVEFRSDVSVHKRLFVWTLDALVRSDRFCFLKPLVLFVRLQFVAQPNCQQLLATLWYDGFPGWRRRHWAVKLVTCFIIGLLFPVFSLVRWTKPTSSPESLQVLLLPSKEQGSIKKCNRCYFYFHLCVIHVTRISAAAVGGHVLASLSRLPHRL